MKKYLLFVTALLYSFTIQAQCPNNPWAPPLKLVGLNFDNDSLHVHYNIDTTLPNNVWQKGAVTKLGFVAALSPVNTMQTDTSQPYPINNRSAVDCWNDSSFSVMGGSPLASVSFWHHYNVDSLADSLLVQLTIDSGKHWLNPSQFKDSLMAGGFGGVIMSFDGIENNNLHPNTSHNILFTGSDTGWTQVSICFTFMAISPPRQLDSSRFGVRFLLVSDSIQTNKPGWEIDDIQFIEPGILSALNEINQVALNIYPMPSRSGEFNVDCPIDLVHGRMEVYDLLGHKMKTMQLSKHISIADLPNGIYFYKANFVDQTGSFYGKLMKE